MRGDFVSAYFNWRFPTGPTVISGTASGFSGPEGNAGLIVSLAIDGTILMNNAFNPAVTATGADGYYQFMLDPQAPGGAVLAWLTRDRFPGGSSSSSSTPSRSLVRSRRASFCKGTPPASIWRPTVC